MSATTIKLEGELLDLIRRTKPASVSVTSYVRKILEANIQQSEMVSAARQYQSFLKKDKTENIAMEEWETASLDQPPSRKRK